MQGDLIDGMVADGKLDTVASAMGDERPPTPAPFVAPRLEGSALLPPAGIHFHLSEEAYHAAPALSCSGIKKLASSPTLFWATTPWLNEDYEPPEEKAHFAIGKAYHARILEGPEAFTDRFCIALDKAAIPDLCVTIDDIKARIEGLGAEPLKKGKKEDFVAQLLELEPDAPIWEECLRRHEEANQGKTPLHFEIVKRIEIAAAMIERHDELSRVLRGGYPEVSLFWTCPKTGVPMKARADYLKRKGIVDLKSYENKFENSPENAIRKTIANQRYNLQPSVYFEGAEAVRKMVRKHGIDAIHVHAPDETDISEECAFAFKWAEHSEPDEWLWIFQQKGPAPITRGVTYPRGGTTKLVSDEIISRAKKRFRLCAETYGTDTWLDLADIYDLADEDIPPWATEI